MKTRTLAIALCAGIAAGSVSAQQTISPSTPVQNPPDEGAALAGQLGPVVLPALLALLAVGAVGSGGGS